jgi:hypothetical protein
MRLLLLSFLISVASVGHASVVENALSNAIRTEQVGRVRMLLQNNPHLDHVGREWSFLWQALFSNEASKQDSPPMLTDAQREIATMLLKADKALLYQPVGSLAMPPLSYLFLIHDHICKEFGCENAKGIEDRIRFLIEQGERIEINIYDDGKIRLPLQFYLAKLRPETFDLALSLGVPVNDEFNVKTEVLIGPMRLLTFLTSLAIGENDPVKSELLLQKIEMLLRRGADPRKMHRSVNGARLPIFVSVFLGWDGALQKPSVQDTSRYPKILRLFFEYGLSEYEDWGDSYISEWPSHESTWRKTTLRMLMQLVTSGVKAPPPSSDCEKKLDQEASQASSK